MTDPGGTDRFDTLFDLIGDPVVEFELVEAEPIVRSINPAFSTVFGYDSDDIVGEALNEYIVPETQADQSRQFDRRTFDGKHNTGLVTRMTNDGAREFFYRGVPASRDGSQYGFAIYTDVTDQRRYERHVRVIHRLLRHDLRNNLQVVAGFAEEVHREAEGPVVAEYGERILEQAERLLTVGEETRIIEKVLLNDSGTHPVDIASSCRSAIDTHTTSFPAATFEADLPETLHCRGNKWLGTAIDALVENAAKHGGPAPTVSVSLTRRQDEVVLDVTDDGPGIPEELRATVFDDKEITKHRHNRGIGLWLVRWVVEACDGHIEYVEADEWTVVRVTLRADSAGE